ncbi:MAG: HAD family hydrolase [Anaerolineales bacterium]|jgi:putative hydrolase of the HAD superfamily
MIRGVIFDFGSTLIAFRGEASEVRALATRAMVKKLNEESVRLDNDVFIQRFYELLETSFAAREASNIEISSMSVLRLVLTEFGYAAVADETLEHALACFYKHFEDHWEPMSDLLAVLDEIHEADYRLGMISNAGNAANVQRLIDKAGIRKYFDPVLISSEVGLRKPHRLLFETVLRRWQLPAEQVVMIGDMLKADVLGAQQVGMHQIWITAEADNENNHQHAVDIVPEATAKILRDVPALIRSLTSRG